MEPERKDKNFNPAELQKKKKPGFKSRISEEDKHKMCKLRADGYTLHSIGAAFGVSHTLVATYTKNYKK